MTATAAPADRSPETRDRQVRRVILIEGAANALVLMLKVTVGLSTGSLAVLSEALHSLSDVANNALAWMVVRVSSQPPDAEHPYGHRKFETLAVFGLASLLTVLAVEIALSALRREAPEVEAEPWALALMGGVLCVNVGVATWENRQAARLGSQILRADARHTFADVLMTLVVIVGWQLAARGYAWLDTACALGVAALVFYLAYGLFRSAIPVLVDRAALDPHAVESAVWVIPRVREVTGVRSRLGDRGPSVDLVITVHPGLSTAESHEVTEEIEALLRDRFGVHDATVHVEPADWP